MKTEIIHRFPLMERMLVASMFGPFGWWAMCAKLASEHAADRGSEALAALPRPLHAGASSGPAFPTASLSN